MNISHLGRQREPMSFPSPIEGIEMHWELYLILLIAALLRLYRLDTAQFMDDHAAFYHMAHDAVAHGLWPISGNRSSTGPLIPPLFVYVMMLPAALSANPVFGNGLVALCNIGAVLLSYVFVHRYFGRLAATIAALLYATSVNVLIFSRDIWQPDLLPLFTLLFLCALFRGVVEQRHYWFLPAVVLLGILYQFHNTSLLLVLPLLVAVILAFRTIRLREIWLAFVALLLIYSPFLYLEMVNHFADMIGLFQVAQRPAVTNNESLRFYTLFVHASVQRPSFNAVQRFDTHIFPGNEHSILLTMPFSFLRPLLPIADTLMPIFLFCGVLTALLLVIMPGGDKQGEGTGQAQGIAPTMVRTRLANGNPYHCRGNPLCLPWRGLAGVWLRWWRGLQASGTRKGLLVLLVWQGLVLLLVRHSVALFAHYLIFLLPGQFILIALFFSIVIQLTRGQLKHAQINYLPTSAQGDYKGQDGTNKPCRTPPGHGAGHGAGHPQGMPLQWYERAWETGSYHCRGIPCGCPAPCPAPRPAPWTFLVCWASLLCIGLILLAQTIGSTAMLVDRARGNFDSNAGYPEYFDLATVQHILGEADQVARERHIARIYATADRATWWAMQYLSEFEQTPTTVFDQGQCLLLPSASTGPVVFIAPPHSDRLHAVLNHYSTAILAKEVPHAGGAPFQIYILSAKPTPELVQQLSNGWQVFSPGVQVLASAHAQSSFGTRWLATSWRIPSSQHPAPRVTYGFHLSYTDETKGTDGHDCLATASWAGDQLITLRDLASATPLPKTISVQAATFTRGPQRYPQGSLKLVTFYDEDGPAMRLRAGDGSERIELAVVEGRL